MAAFRNVENAPQFERADFASSSSQAMRAAGPDSDREALAHAVPLMSALLQSSPGLFVGDLHGEVSIPKFLVTILPDLKEAGLKFLCMEMIYSDDQAILDRLRVSGDATELRSYLEDRWECLLSDSIAAEWLNLVQAAQSSAIEVLAIDIKVPGGLMESQDQWRERRSAISNPHWAAIVERRLADAPPESKFLVYGGRAHGADGVTPGVHTLLGIPAVIYSSENGAHHGEPVLAKETESRFALHLRSDPAGTSEAS